MSDAVSFNILFLQDKKKLIYRALLQNKKTSR